MRQRPIYVYNVQYRRAGEDYEVRSFRTVEDAEGFATKFLQGFVWNGEWDASLQQLENYCASNDLAYVEITEQVI